MPVRDGRGECLFSLSTSVEVETGTFLPVFANYVRNAADNAPGSKALLMRERHAPCSGHYSLLTCPLLWSTRPNIRSVWTSPTIKYIVLKTMDDR